MPPLLVVDYDLIYSWVAKQQLSHCRLDKQRDVGVGKEASQSSQRRLAHHRIAEPVRSPHEESMNVIVTHRHPPKLVWCNSRYDDEVAPLPLSPVWKAAPPTRHPSVSVMPR